MQTFLRAVGERFHASDLPAAREVASGIGSLARDVPRCNIQNRYLAECLALPNRHALAEQLAVLGDYLPWADSTVLAKIPYPFRDQFSYCELIGPSSAIRAETFRVGLYIQHPDAFYPLHSHEAEELYLPISGTAYWWRDGVANSPASPGTLIHHAPNERHATRTLAEPMLAVWAWTGTLDAGTYRCDAEPPSL